MCSSTIKRRTLFGTGLIFYLATVFPQKVGGEV